MAKKKQERTKNWHTSIPKGRLPVTRRTIEKGVHKIDIGPSEIARDTTYMFVTVGGLWFRWTVQQTSKLPAKADTSMINNATLSRTTKAPGRSNSSRERISRPPCLFQSR